MNNFTFNKLQEDEIPQVKRIHSKVSQFPFPNLESPLYCIQKVIKDKNGTIIGSYLLHITAEISLILDDKVNDFTKARIVLDLRNQIYEDCNKMGIEDVHVFVIPENDKMYAELLKKNLGFITPTGIPLYRKVNS